MINTSYRTIALTNLQWKVAHGIIGLKILADKGEETPFLKDLETACNVAANGKGVNRLLPSVPVTANEASQLSELLGETKRKLDQCAKSRSSVEDALSAAQKLYQYVEDLCRPNFSQFTA